MSIKPITKKLGFAIISGAGDTYPSVKIAKSINKTNPDIEIEWVVVGKVLPILEEFKNITLIEIEDWGVLLETGKPNPSEKAMQVIFQKFEEFDKEVFRRSQKWDMVVIAPALFICEIAERCKLMALSFQNNFFTHPDTWIHGVPGYEYYAAKQKILQRPGVFSLLLWPKSIYSISPEPRESHKYLGYPKTTSIGNLTKDLISFLSIQKQNNIETVFITMGSLSFKGKDEWKATFEALSQHVAIIADCRHQPISKEEIHACVRNHPIILIEQDVSFEQLFANIDWVICHGGVGTVSMALYCEKPILLMPGHFEQKWWARKHVYNGYAKYLQYERLEEEGYVADLLKPESRQACLEQVKAFKQASSFDGLETAANTIVEHLTAMD